MRMTTDNSDRNVVLNVSMVECVHKFALNYNLSLFRKFINRVRLLVISVYLCIVNKL